jgi:hypothetical protein
MAFLSFSSFSILILKYHQFIDFFEDFIGAGAFILIVTHE